MVRLKKVQKYIRYSFIKKKKKSKRLIWDDAPDINIRIENLVEKTGIGWIKKKNIFTLRSEGTKSKAIARIWGLSRVWQKVLNKEPHYIIEVVSERFDKLSEKDKNEVLLHEIAHIPKNFSGALVPHYRRGKNKFKDLVGTLINQYKNK